MFSTFVRRFSFGVACAATVTLALATPAAAISVGHSTGRALVAQAGWGSVDPETFTGDWGLVAAFEQDGMTGIVLYEEDSVAITCQDGSPGIAGSLRSGQGPADVLSIARDLRSSVASGTVMVISGSFDTCTQSWEMTGEETVSIALDLTASGRRDVTVDRYSDAVPGEYRFTSRSLMATRPATGSVLIDGAPVAYATALISSHSFSDHFLTH